MKERGMIFNAEMVRALLDGRKTQTRRIIKNQREGGSWSVQLAKNPCIPRHTHDWWLPNATQPYSALICPFGAIGERIWVRETWARYNIDQRSQDMAYRATTPEDWPDGGRWRPSIHMPRWASRILLEITDVRVERLNSISEEDAQAEGMELTGWRPTYSDPDSGGEVWTPYDNFAQLWESIYGEESWKANNWVWVIEFKVVNCGGD
ncbi:morphogenetic protein [Raoultella sp. HC6]|uniref:morphogenetic protein n=1 Tax=Raoultella sp. HC6 TaxID=2923366 RepID=UPI001F50C261|nr:morphogenetic protein [Raoultella sp. HC6]